jgi:uncharacterized protein
MAAPFPTTRISLAGEAGNIEVAAHVPLDTAPRAVAVVAHPHPLFGGSMDNKVVTTLARTFFDCGAAVYRFNFRGVGASEGAHDEGRGETADLSRVIAYAQAQHAGKSLWLSGFSFGGAVTLAACEAAPPQQLLLVAPGFKRLLAWKNLADASGVPGNAVIIHGEIDDTVPVSESLEWARPRGVPVIVVPGAEHFFHQRLHILKRITATWMGAGMAGADNADQSNP